MTMNTWLKQRIVVLVDGRRSRGLRVAGALTVVGVMLVLVGLLGGGYRPLMAASSSSEDEALRMQQIDTLKRFAAAKEKQSREYSGKKGDDYSPDFARFFAAAAKGDGATVTNLYESFKKRHGQYENAKDDLPHDASWAPVLEVALSYYEIMEGEPRYEQLVIDGTMAAVPPGSIYFGGTDPGRGLPTAFSKSHIDADPFFTLTQNALADGTYLEYLRLMYGDRIAIPTEGDSQDCFKDYLSDAQRRLESGRLKPGEDVRVVDNRVQVSGQVAVMTINAMLVKIIFDKNPEREFFIEESFPLDWMYPQLSPKGPILKLHRKPLVEMPEDLVDADRAYWRPLVAQMVGDWLDEQTTAREVADFVKKVHVDHDLEGFKGDPHYIRNEHSQKLVSKLRSSSGGVYAWRADHRVIGNGEPEGSKEHSERERMQREADFAFRQAVVLCPRSPEAIFRYVNLLVGMSRVDDALVITETALLADPDNGQLKSLRTQLQGMKKE